MSDHKGPAWEAYEHYKHYFSPLDLPQLYAKRQKTDTALNEVLQNKLIMRNPGIYAFGYGKLVAIDELIAENLETRLTVEQIQF